MKAVETVKAVKFDHPLSGEAKRVWEALEPSIRDEIYEAVQDEVLRHLTHPDAATEIWEAAGVYGPQPEIASSA